MGRIYAPTGELWWAKTGAQLPTVEVVEGEGLLRIYYAAKDEEGYGRTGFVDVSAANPSEVVHVSPGPVLDVGELGTFDDSGACPSTVVQTAGRKFLYYQGFQRSGRVPYLTFTGLAIAEAGTEAFRKQSRIPIMDRSDEEPFIRSTCSILIQDGIWKMWYVSTVKWTTDANGLHYVCVIRSATSRDGIQWMTQPHLCLEPAAEDEYAVGRPSVIYEENTYKMWYSIRSFTKFYTIGYAESDDGIHWERKDHLSGIEKSASGWDSEMICYPYVVNVQGKRLLFYNGNQRGVSGFGYAVYET